MDGNAAATGPAGSAVWFRSSVGKKAVMAATGTILTLFVIFHLLGNLQLFQGEEALDRYARLLRAEPVLLWAVRLILLASALLHIAFGTILYFENRGARPSRYAVYRPVQATIASRTMIFSGIIVMAFIVYHLLHLTFGAAEPSGYSFGRHTVYRNVVAGFRDPWITGVYILGMLLLYLHLSHGIESMFQSAGWRTPGNEGTIRGFAQLLALLIAAGNILMPLAVLVGWVR
jgi:succinate dehydrogenase / fumarate reductase cytochrome b subunit